jgi:serine/threonine protein kinase
MLMETGSQHIPKVYSFVNRDLGQGTGGLNIDHKNHEVHRIFMEYCIGDLDGMIKKLRRDNAFLEEYELWSIFVCLAKVVSLLDCGNEKAEQPAAGTPWKDSTLIHFDIKTSNSMWFTSALWKMILTRPLVFLGEREARGDEPNPETDEHIMYERILVSPLILRNRGMLISMQLGDFGQAAWIPRNHSYKITKEHAWKNSIKAPVFTRF